MHNFEGHKKIQTSLVDKGYIIKKLDDRIASQESIPTDGKSKRESFYTITIPEEHQDLFNIAETVTDNPNMRLVDEGAHKDNLTENPFMSIKEDNDDMDAIDEALSDINL